MQITSADRIVIAVIGAYWCYRLLVGLQTGIYDGDGDGDVHAERHPTAFVLSIASGFLVVALCAAVALGFVSVR